RLCGRPWDERHIGKSCEELDPELMKHKMAEKLTEMLTRKCPRCKRPFVKNEGCNKISCPCGQNSCYICKKELEEGYDHFNGQGGDDPGKCPLWDDPSQRDQAAAEAELQRQIAAADGDVAEDLRRLQ
ncbi:hypothetical protein PFISCL1PPCAC_16741, partial [Pristionchus fissidentatus]